MGEWSPSPAGLSTQLARGLVRPLGAGRLTHLGARPLLARSRALRCSDAPSSTPARLAPRAAWRLSAPAAETHDEEHGRAGAAHVVGELDAAHAGGGARHQESAS